MALAVGYWLNFVSVGPSVGFPDLTVGREGSLGELGDGLPDSCTQIQTGGLTQTLGGEGLHQFLWGELLWKFADWVVLGSEGVQLEISLTADLLAYYKRTAGYSAGGVLKNEGRLQFIVWEGSAFLFVFRSDLLFFGVFDQIINIFGFDPSGTVMWGKGGGVGG